MCRLMGGKEGLDTGGKTKEWMEGNGERGERDYQWISRR